MTSTLALTNATMPYALEIANKGVAAAIRGHRSIATGANIVNGSITHRSVAEAFEMPYRDVLEVV
jgi:alanine dehydrogenase